MMASAFLTGHGCKGLGDYFEDGRVPELGDMIQFKRDWYSHWALYIGDGEVVHRWAEGDGISTAAGPKLKFALTPSGYCLDKAQVQVNHIREVWEGAKAKINNYKGKSRYSGRQIVARALKHVGKMGYNIVWQNCEHFCTEIRHGAPESKQVQDTVTGIAVAGGAILGGALLYNWLSDDKKGNK